MLSVTCRPLGRNKDLVRHVHPWSDNRRRLLLEIEMPRRCRWCSTPSPLAYAPRFFQVIVQHVSHCPCFPSSSLSAAQYSDTSLVAPRLLATAKSWRTMQARPCSSEMILPAPCVLQFQMARFNETLSAGGCCTRLIDGSWN